MGLALLGATAGSLPLADARAQTPAEATFRRGDFNDDGEADLSDAIALLLHLFAGHAAPVCSSAGDSNDDGALATADVVSLLGHLFIAGAPPPPPHPGCGPDPTPDDLPCAGSSRCPPPDARPEITEWPVPWASTRPRDPHFVDPAKVWFCGQTGNYLAVFEPETEEFTRYDLPARAGPHNLIVGEEHVWYSGNTDAHIGRLDPSTGAIDIFEMPDPAARDPHTLVFDSKGDIWFTVQLGNFVGRLLPSTGEVRLARVPTANARPYGIVIDGEDTPWFVEFGTNKLARIDPASFAIEEFTLPRGGARPRRIGVARDGAIWYVDHAQGYLGRFTPGDRTFREWRAPAGASSDPYGMAMDHLDRPWFVETGVSPNRLVGFDPAAEAFIGSTPIPSGGGTVRHMFFHEPSREIWFGTDRNTLGRARIP